MNTIHVQRPTEVPGNELITEANEGVVRVKIEAAGERDLWAKTDAEDLILNIARVMGWQVSVQKHPDAVDTA